RFSCKEDVAGSNPVGGSAPHGSPVVPSSLWCGDVSTAGGPMPQIEHRIELDAELTNPDFSGRVLTPEEIVAGEHRRYVGGVWESHGRRQLEGMISDRKSTRTNSR